MIDLTPALIKYSKPSAKGKKASEAAADPIISLGKNLFAFLQAISDDPTRLV